jgi:hypothetical protein
MSLQLALMQMVLQLQTECDKKKKATPDEYSIGLLESE